MSNRTVISVENLGKSYRISHQAERQRYVALRDVIAGKFQRLLHTRPSSPGAHSSTEDFWALKEVGFEVKQGEVIGIIGRNGAGKSTLLKILSRITEPSKGRVRIKGRVASLLEVGTGFHPELTGRENIYLNGAILGMSRAEIKTKFDEIVSFAEVERFLDTPVKRYSSGMYVRLAFAVAAHLEPEILIVDEVLAVGDAEFQKKCLGRMHDVAKGGRTVLFVSHQMAAIQNLCRTGLLLTKGKIAKTGAIGDVVNHYLAESTHLAELSFEQRTDREGTGVLRFTDVTFRNADGVPVAALNSGAPAILELHMTNTGANALRTVRFAFGVQNHLGQRILTLATLYTGEDFSVLGAEVTSVEVRIPRLTLAPDRYGFTLFASVNGEVADWIRNAGTFDVEAGDFYGTGQLPPEGQGCLLMEHAFTMGHASGLAR